MSQGQRVLVLEGLSEIQEVLQAVLEPRGLTVDRASVHAERVSDAHSGRPDILVIDAEAIAPNASHAGDWSGIPQVIISNHRRAPAAATETAGRHYLHKPFRYPELIAAIERLLP